jgi:hypothetical protein
MKQIAFEEPPGFSGVQMPTQVSPLSQAVQSALSNVTPVRLWLLLFLISLCSVIFGIASIITIEQHEHAINTVGNDAAPSVIAAHQIKIGVEMMDASLADELLYPPNRREAQNMADEFEQSRLNVCKQLVAAAKNITYGTSEELPIEKIQIALGRFEMQAQQARDLHDAGEDSEAVGAYRGALTSLLTELLPNADKLNKANADVLEDTYAREKGISAMSRGFVMVMGLVLVGLLLYTQLYLSMHFRRRLNFPLIFITVVAAIFLQHLTSSLADSSNELKIAKEDAYNSIVALLDARANAYDANAAESRWLLDRKHAAVHEKYFREKMASVARFDAGHDFASTIARARTQLGNSEKFNLPGMSGSLADELNNIIFPEEGEAALESLKKLADYTATDAKMRQMESDGKHDQAVSVGLGYDPKGSNFLFSKFDDALGRTLKINEYHMKNAVNQATRELDGLVAGSLLVTFVALLCTYAGLRPRLEEYHPLYYLHKRPKH